MERPPERRLRDWRGRAADVSRGVQGVVRHRARRVRGEPGGVAARGGAEKGGGASGGGDGGEQGDRD
eukprot:31374-Pelagococcus_subviridis.AAC.2